MYIYIYMYRERELGQDPKSCAKGRPDLLAPFISFVCALFSRCPEIEADVHTY